MAGRLTLDTSTAPTVALSRPTDSTFFQVKYAKLQRFAMEQARQEFEEAAEFGTWATATIKPVGNTLCGCELEVTLRKRGNRYPAAHGMFYPVEALCRRIRLRVGSTWLDDFDSDYLRHYDTWHRDGAAKTAHMRSSNFDPATMDDGQEHTETLSMTIPFGFTRNYGLGLPLGKEGIQVCVEFSTADEVGVCPRDFTARLFCTFAHLDGVTPTHDRLVPTVQSWTQKLTGGPRAGGLSSHAYKLPFEGPVKNVMWCLKETVAPPPHRSFHARYVGDPDGTCLALQPSPYDASGYGMFQIVSEKLAPIFDAALSYNNRATVIHRRGTHFNRATAWGAAGQCSMPGLYFHSWALNPSDLNPEGYVDLSPDLSLWLHFRTKASTADMTDVADGEGVNIEGLRELKVYAEGYQLMTFENGMLTLPWTYSSTFEPQQHVKPSDRSPGT